MPATKPILCPTCRKMVEPTGEDFPFCSDRCRVIDLGKWASGDYKIASPIFDEELLDELEKAQQAQPTDESKWKN
jgi:endogenous inhibitor of DNA gyrase (YacG/DUF329 family)